MERGKKIFKIFNKFNNINLYYIINFIYFDLITKNN